MFDLPTILNLMLDHGCSRVFAKVLAPNDDSKHGIYLGSDFDSIGLFPRLQVRAAGRGAKGVRFRARLRLSWITPSGNANPAPHASLVMYPQYPEVRLTSFLRSSPEAPSAIMNSGLAGRCLFLGVAADGGVFALVASPSDPLQRSIDAQPGAEKQGVFTRLLVGDSGLAEDGRVRLLSELRRVHQRGWIPSKRLTRRGVVPCEARNCGGYTLEAELGIAANGAPLPDFLGWEVKQHGVKSFENPGGGVLTLFTPEPRAGYYKEAGVVEFIREYGYNDLSGKEDRLNVGGVYRIGAGAHARTGLSLEVRGFDTDSGEIVDEEGVVLLVDRADHIAASWRFDRLWEHWERKHNRAAYVPSMVRDEPAREYMYGSVVKLGMGTSFPRFLKALAAGLVYYDPGLKLEHVSTPNPTAKRRNQFRVKLQDVDCLYKAVEVVDVMEAS